MFKEKPPHPSTTIPIAPSNVALIVGVTGITGLSLVESLLSPSSPGAPWTIYGAARSHPPPWFPLATIHRFLQLDVLDPTSTLLALSPLSPPHHPPLLRRRHLCRHRRPKHRHARQRPSLPPRAPPRGAPNRLHLLPRRPAGRRPVSRRISARGPPALLLGARGRGRSLRRQADVDGPPAVGDSRSVGLERLQSGPHVGRLRAHLPPRGVPLVYPGNEYTWRNVCCDASDAGMVAEQEIWAAAGNPTAGNEAFNCTNGDAFAWGGLWEVVAGEFGVGHVARGGEGWEWVGRMKGKRGVWDLIVEEGDLVRTRLDEIANFEYLYVMTNFEFEMVSCMRKSREFGFERRVDTMESVKKWIGRLRGMNVIPKN